MSAEGRKDSDEPVERKRKSEKVGRSEKLSLTQGLWAAFPKIFHIF